MFITFYNSTCCSIGSSNVYIPVHLLVDAGDVEHSQCKQNLNQLQLLMSNEQWNSKFKICPGTSRGKKSRRSQEFNKTLALSPYGIIEALSMFLRNSVFLIAL